MFFYLSYKRGGSVRRCCRAARFIKDVVIDIGMCGMLSFFGIHRNATKGQVECEVGLVDSEC